MKAPTDDRTSRPSGWDEKLPGLGWGMIGFSFIKPLVSVAAGSNAHLQGERMGQMMMLAIALFVLLGLALRKSSRRAKNYGRIAIGATLLGVSAWPLAQAGATETEKAFVRESQAIQARQMTAAADLAKRFNAVNMNGLLTAATLTSESETSKARATLATFRSILLERKQLLERSNTEFETFINTRSPSQADKRAALSDFQSNKALTAKMYGDLDATQSAYADVVERVLNWGTTQSKAKKLSAKGGQLQFASASQQQELQTLLATLEVAERKVNEAVASAGVLQARAQAKLQEGNRQAAEILRK